MFYKKRLSFYSGKNWFKGNYRDESLGFFFVEIIDNFIFRTTDDVNVIVRNLLLDCRTCAAIVC